MGDQLYNYELQKAYVYQFSQVRSQPLSFNHVPFELIVFLPLAGLSYPMAFLAWAAVNVLILFWVAKLLQPHCSSLVRQIPVFLALLLFYPIAVTLMQGQDSILLLLILCLTYVLLKRGAEDPAGAVLALGLFKLQLVLPVFAVAALGKRSKLCRGFMVTAVILGLVSVYMVGPRGLGLYVDLLRQQNQGLTDRSVQERWYIFPSNMPNLRGLLQSWFLGVVSERVLNLGILLLSGLLVLWTGRQWMRERDSSAALDLQFSLAVIVAVLVSFHLYTHDLSVVVLPVLLVGEHVLRAGAAPKFFTRSFGVLVLPFFLSPLYGVLKVMEELHWLCPLLLALAWLISAGLRSVSPVAVQGSTKK